LKFAGCCATLWHLCFIHLLPLEALQERDALTEQPEPNQRDISSPRQSIPIDPSPLQDNPAIQRHPNTDQIESASSIARELHWLEKLNIVGQLSLVAVGVMAASIYGCQLESMNAQLKEMQNQTKIQKNVRIESERAWVGINFPNWDAGEEISGRGFGVPIELVNTGRTPARKVSIRAKVIIVHGQFGPTDLDPLVSQHYILIRYELIQPDQKIRFPFVPALDVDGDGNTVTVVTTPELRTHVKDATYTVTITGRVTYEDFIGGEHGLRSAINLMA
jgi:hypothetical protein